MKILRPIIFSSLLAILTLNSFAQRIRVIEGTVPADLKNEQSINTEFTYDNMGVGKFDKEDDYVNNKKDEYNKKEAGKGDTWAKKWVEDRTQRFEPKFDELFSKNTDFKIDNKAKYTLILHTIFTEPGFNAIAIRKSAYINAEILIVETANKSKVLAKLSIDKSPGNAMWGNDYDTGERISESYAKAGKSLGKYIK